MNHRVLEIIGNEIDPAYAIRAQLIFGCIEKYKPRSVLDVGCGRGFYLNVFTLYSNIRKIVGIDIRKDNVRIARKKMNDKRVRIICGDIRKVNLVKSKFDLIILSEVLEHVEDDLNFLFRLKSYLNPGGKLVLTVPNYNFLFFWDPLNYMLMKFFDRHINKKIWWLAGIWADHERLYTEQDVKKITRKSGYRIVDKKKVLNFCWPFSHFILYGVGKNIIEKINIKSLNRFDINKRSLLSKLLSKFMMMPERLFSKIGIKTTRSVNLFYLLENAKE